MLCLSDEWICVDQSNLPHCASSGMHEYSFLFSMHCVDLHVPQKHAKSLISFTMTASVHAILRPYFYIKVTGAKNIFRPRNFNIKIGPGDEANASYTV